MPLKAPWDKPTETVTETAIEKAVAVDAPVVLNNTTRDVARRAALFGVAYAAISLIEDAAEIVVIPDPWGVMIGAAITTAAYGLRQWFLLEMQQRGA